MVVPIIMPRQGQSVESCVIVKFYKNKGDLIHIGDLLFSYETDKARFDEESKAEGVLLEIYVKEGDDVPVLSTVCVIGDLGEDISEFGIEKESEIPEKFEIKETNPIVMETDFKEEVLNEGLSPISPRAKKLALKAGVDYRFFKGSGPQGRIIEKDIRLLQKNGSLVTSAARAHIHDQIMDGKGLGGRITTEDLQQSQSKEMSISEAMVVETVKFEFEEVKMTNIRKLIAKSMHHSISSTAQLTLNTSFDASDMMAFRKKLKEAGDGFGLENITLNDMIVYAVSRVLMDHKELNAHILDDKMRYFKNVHIGVAVDTDRGLMVPTLVNANLKSLNEISKEIKHLIKACQLGTINPDLLQGGTFTITNLGSLDIESFTPILNPPQTGILGVNNTVQRVKESEGGHVYYPAMGLSITFDHRALDGAPAARFLKALNTNLENFSILLVK